MLVSKIYNEVLQAESRIRKYVRETYLEYSPVFSEACGSEVYMKLENLQLSGSFKIRGAVNKIKSLSEEQLSKGIVTASSGNHGAAVSLALKKLNTPGLIFVPDYASETKLSSIRVNGAEIRKYGSDQVDTEIFARKYASENDMTFISPYNDQVIVGGQGTIGVELIRQLDDLDAVFISIGGGGLISGISTYLKSNRPDIEIIGCSPENSKVMMESVKAGRILELPSLPTISDGTAGGLEPGTITFDLCRELVDDYIAVSEEEIKDSMRLFMKSHHMMIEGAAGVALAPLFKYSNRFKGKKVAVIICGANISPDALKTVL
jgi:threonine dehydratase